mgnify:CR=1 FL=1
MNNSHYIGWVSKGFYESYRNHYEAIRSFLLDEASIELNIIDDSVLSSVARTTILSLDSDTVLVVFTDAEKADGRQIYGNSLYKSQIFYSVPVSESDGIPALVKIIHGLVGRGVNEEDIENLFEVHTLKSVNAHEQKIAKKLESYHKVLEAYQRIESKGSRAGSSDSSPNGGASGGIFKAFNEQQSQINELQEKNEELLKQLDARNIELQDAQNQLTSAKHVINQGALLLNEYEQLKKQNEQYGDAANEVALMLDNANQKAETLSSVNKTLTDQLTKAEEERDRLSRTLEEYRSAAYLPVGDLGAPLPRVVSKNLGKIPFPNITFFGVGDSGSMEMGYKVLQTDVLGYAEATKTYELDAPLLVDLSRVSNAAYRFNCRPSKGSASWLTSHRAASLCEVDGLAIPQGRIESGLSVYAPATENGGMLQEFEMFNIDWLQKFTFLNHQVENGTYGRVVVFLGDLTSPFGASMLRDLIDMGNYPRIYISGSQISLNSMEKLTRKIVADSSIDPVNSWPSYFTEKDILNNYDAFDTGIAQLDIEEIVADTYMGRKVKSIFPARNYLNRYYAINYIQVPSVH